MSAQKRWGVVLGFALGGFFDGILLHQILQWHHLLSLVPGLADIRLQVLWDGYFHALMYIVAAVGLWGLWQARHDAGLGHRYLPLGSVLVGFGLWHVVDAIVSHWLLGIHRIKLDSDVPLTWDIAWLIAFGAAPLGVGWLIMRGGAASAGRQPPFAMLLLALVTTGTGAWSLRPPPDQPFTTVVFRPGLARTEVLASIVAANARLVWADPATALSSSAVRVRQQAASAGPERKAAPVFEYKSGGQVVCRRAAPPNGHTRA